MNGLRTSVSIKVEFTCGDSIENAFWDAVTLANRIGCCIEFDFNQTTCLAFPESNPNTGIDSYHKALKDKISIATTR